MPAAAKFGFIVEGPASTTDVSIVEIASGGELEGQVREPLIDTQKELLELDRVRRRPAAFFDVKTLPGGRFFAYVDCPYIPTPASPWRKASRALNYAVAILAEGGAIRTTFDCWQLALSTVARCLQWQEIPAQSVEKKPDGLVREMVDWIGAAMFRSRAEPDEVIEWEGTWEKLIVSAATPEGGEIKEAPLVWSNGRLETDPAKDAAVFLLCRVLGRRLRLKGEFKDIRPGCDIAGRVVYTPSCDLAVGRLTRPAWEDIRDLPAGDYFADVGPHAPVLRLRRYCDEFVRDPDPQRAARIWARFAALDEPCRSSAAFAELVVDLLAKPEWTSQPALGGSLAALEALAFLGRQSPAPRLPRSAGA